MHGASHYIDTKIIPGAHLIFHRYSHPLATLTPLAIPWMKFGEALHR